MIRTEQATSKVYFVQNARSGDVKIGYTADLSRRLASLRLGAGADLHLLRSIEGGPARERWLHRKFAEHRVCGEWFEYQADMMTVVPPDEIMSAPIVVKRRDVRLTVRERLRDAEVAGREAGLTDRLILATFVSTLSDEEARQLMDKASS